MKYAILFSVLASMLGTAAFLSAVEGDWWVSALEGYIAIGLIALASAYGLKQAGIAVEEVARHPRWTIVLHFLLAPYRILAWLTLGVARQVSREGGMSRVAPGLHIGRLPSKAERGRLQEIGIDAVLDLCAEFPHRQKPEDRSNAAYVPILDGSPPTARQFREAVDWILARRAEGLNVLIHCAQGHGRSATVAAVTLCRLGVASDIDEAIEKIRSCRPKARPSKAQRLAAIRFLASIDPCENAKGAGLSTRPLA